MNRQDVKSLLQLMATLGAECVGKLQAVARLRAGMDAKFRGVTVGALGAAGGSGVVSEDKGFGLDSADKRKKKEKKENEQRKKDRRRSREETNQKK